MGKRTPLDNATLCKAAYDCLRRGTFGIKEFPGFIKTIIITKAWEAVYFRPTGEIFHFKSLAEMITASLLKGGWEQDIKQVEAVIKNDPEVLVLFREAMKLERGGDHTTEQGKQQAKCNNVTDCNAITGNSKSYTISRLQKQHPDLYQEVVDGKLSANKAAIKAGFRKPPKTAEEKILDLFRKLDDKTKRKVLLEQLANTNDKTRRYIHSQLI